MFVTSKFTGVCHQQITCVQFTGVCHQQISGVCHQQIETLAEGQIHIRLPLALGDLLFGNEHVDVQELIKGLTELKTDLVTVQGRVNGRIWVQ